MFTNAPVLHNQAEHASIPLFRDSQPHTVASVPQLDTAPDSHSTAFKSIAPVIFFIFNRPHYTQRVVSAIRQARPSHLFVVADGPRPSVPADRQRCEETRALVEDAIDWPCRLERDYSEINMGCSQRIVSGIRWAFGMVCEAIILEDDCLPSPSFFRFCSEMLDRYRADRRVGMITGTNYRVRSDERSGSSYLFSRHCSIWGWATWRRSIEGFDPSMRAWRTEIGPRETRAWFADGRSRLLHETMFDLAREKGVDTWDIPWVFHLARQTLLSAVPSSNLVSNIGVQGTRGRAGDQNNLMGAHDIAFPLKHPDAVIADDAYDRLVTARHRIVRDWLRAKWRNRIRRMFHLRP